MLNRLLGRAPKAPARVRIDPAGIELETGPRQTILAAALEAGIPFPYNCRVGGCATCKCRLVEGSVKELTDKSYLLTAEELDRNFILACQSIPRGDVVVEHEGIEARATAVPAIRTRGRIAGLQPLTHDILELSLDVDEALHYVAGQYADLSVPEHPELADQARSYSFSTRPEAAGNHRLVFHVRRVPGGSFTTWLHDHARPGDVLDVHGPWGEFRLQPAGAPILAIAGGSGLAPIKAILEQARHEQSTREVVFLFGARTQADLYCVDEIEGLARRWLSRLRFVPVLSEEPASSDWKGRRGLVTAHLDAVGPELAEHHAYLCGPPPMVDAAIAALEAAGVDPTQIRYDKFLDRSHTQPPRAAT